MRERHRGFLVALARAGVPSPARIPVGRPQSWPFLHEAMRWGLPPRSVSLGMQETLPFPR